MVSIGFEDPLSGRVEAGFLAWAARRYNGTPAGGNDMRVLVLQHIACEHPGIFRDFMAEDGIEWRAVELDEGEPIPELDGFDVLLSMGGPMDVWQKDAHPWIASELAAIRDWVGRSRRPFLGFCLGHKLLAEAMGGEVGPAAEPEIGVMPVRLTDAGRASPFLQGVPDEFPCLQWHSAEVTGSRPAPKSWSPLPPAPSTRCPGRSTPSRCSSMSSSRLTPSPNGERSRNTPRRSKPRSARARLPASMPGPPRACRTSPPEPRPCVPRYAPDQIRGYSG